jgi:hypothetical protein
MTPREQAKALLLLQAWRRLVQDGRGNVDQLLATTVEFLTLELSATSRPTEAPVVTLEPRRCAASAIPKTCASFARTQVVVDDAPLRVQPDPLSRAHRPAPDPASGTSIGELLLLGGRAEMSPFGGGKRRARAHLSRG